MKTKCIKCGKVFDDNYFKVNKLNVRIWCNNCIDKMEKEKLQKNIFKVGDKVYFKKDKDKKTFIVWNILNDFLVILKDINGKPQDYAVNTKHLTRMKGGKSD